MVKYELIVGKKVSAYLSILSNFRESQFKSPPYSYAFNQLAENEYLQEYSTSKHSVCILAKKNTKAIGIVTGLPLNAGGVIISEAEKNISSISYNINDFFYVCEVIVLPEYRSHGIGKFLMQQIEQHAINLGKKYMCLLTIDHPIAKSNFWSNLKYEKINLYETHHWPTYVEDNVIDLPHKLIYWIKQIPLGH